MRGTRFMIDSIDHGSSCADDLNNTDCRELPSSTEWRPTTSSRWNLGRCLNRFNAFDKRRAPHPAETLPQAGPDDSKGDTLNARWTIGCPKGVPFDQ